MLMYTRLRFRRPRVWTHTTKIACQVQLFILFFLAAVSCSPRTALPPFSGLLVSRRNEEEIMSKILFFDTYPSVLAARWDLAPLYFFFFFWFQTPAVHVQNMCKIWFCGCDCCRPPNPASPPPANMVRLCFFLLPGRVFACSCSCSCSCSAKVPHRLPERYPEPANRRAGHSSPVGKGDTGEVK